MGRRERTACDPKKRKYPNQLAALRAITHIARRKGDVKRAVRAYPCGEHPARHWHLTSRA